MLTCLGRGLSPLASVRPVRHFALTSSLSSPLSYARNDGVATYLNSNGDLCLSSANIPRFDHSATGKALGLLIEPSRTNKCSAVNLNPSDTTGISISGTGASLTVIDDTTELANAGLDKICTNGKVYKLVGGSTTAVASISGSFGNTNAHSYSVYARGVGVSSVGQLKRSGSGSTVANIMAGGGYSRYIVENDIPGYASTVLYITAYSGEEVWFILFQAEEGPYVTSPIYINGASATRQADDLFINAPNAFPWFNEAQGMMSVSFRTRNKLTTSDQYLAVAHNGTTAETIGFRIGNDHDMRGYVRSLSVNKHSVDNNDEAPLPGDYLHSASIIWKSGEAHIISSSVRNTQSYSGDPSGLMCIDLGSSISGSNSLFGHITRIEISSYFPADLNVGAALSKDFDYVILGSGQSNMSGYFNSADSGSGGGRLKFLEEFKAAQSDLDILWALGATGGAALLEEATTDQSNYFIDDSTGLWDGDAYTNLVSALETSGNKCELFIWDQGEQDAHNLSLSVEPSKATYKTRLLELFTKLRTQLGAIPILIIPLGRRSSGFTNTGGMQIIRDVQRELAAENTWVHLGPEKVDQGLSVDGVHLTDTGYQTMGQRLARKSLDLLGYSQNGVDGPSITGAVRNGTSVTVTLTHDAGSDFTPASGIEGFHFFDGGAKIAITAAVRTNSTTITLTLASEPTGVEELYYLYDDEAALNPANLVIDDGNVSLPLRSAKIVL